MREGRRAAKGEKRSPNGRPPSPRHRHDDGPSPSAVALRGLSSPWRTGRALGTRHAPSQDGCPTGRGTTYSPAVTRCRSACTGQALGSGRRRRSCYCWTWAAPLQRVRRSVAGGAWARAVCGSGGGRKA